MSRYRIEIDPPVDKTEPFGWKVWESHDPKSSFWFESVNGTASCAQDALNEAVRAWKAKESAQKSTHAVSSTPT